MDRQANDLEARMLDQSEGRGFDVVIEVTGSPAVAADMLGYPRPRGRRSHSA